MFKKKKNIHFIGIGGIGMSAIAAILAEKGFKVSGSDLNENFIINKLKKKKIRVYLGHSKILSEQFSPACLGPFSSSFYNHPLL